MCHAQLSQHRIFSKESQHKVCSTLLPSKLSTLRSVVSATRTRASGGLAQEQSSSPAFARDTPVRTICTDSGGDERWSLPGGAIDRRQALSKVWKAALSLSAVSAAVVASGGASPAEAGIVEDIGGFLLPPQDKPTEIEVGDVDKEVSFEEFERTLLKGEVARCEFFGSNFDKAVIILKDGTRALIGEGYPQERAFSDDSPMKAVALLRNAGVPFTTQFRTSKYAKPRVYKTSETVEAENRQKSEDAALEALMAQ